MAVWASQSPYWVWQFLLFFGTVPKQYDIRSYWIMLWRHLTAGWEHIWPRHITAAACINYHELSTWSCIKDLTSDVSMYACCFPKTCPSTSTILLKNQEISRKMIGAIFLIPSISPKPRIRGVLSVRFLQLSLLEGGCADASFTTYKPSFGSSLAFILGWLQHQVMARDGWIRKKHPCCSNHCLIKPETCSI